MLSSNVIVIICLIYVGFLFAVAGLAERRARQSKLGFLHSPLIYTLSISVYCTAWTFYGSVGSAALNGFEFLAIYLGPTIVFVGWWWFLRKLVRIGRTQRITSIADLISSRYGKSNTLGVIVTLLAIFGSTPYIALQLQSLTLSFAVFTENSNTEYSSAIAALFIAAGLALFTILFGTRNLDANERHHGVVTAIALEAIVKLVAFISVGIFVVWGLSDGPSSILNLMEKNIPVTDKVFSPRWVTLTFLSATAIICLPRMFQVIVVENSAEKHLATASWAFPLYLLLMCIFVLPIAATGLNILPEGSNPDLFVLTIPLAENQGMLAALAFLGGFSSATSMVIVAAIALSTMASNHIVLPLWLYAVQKRNPESDDVRTVLLRSRRFSIACIIGFGYLYYILTGGTTALASIGLIAFLGVAQVLPALIGALFWRNATRKGAIFGISTGFIIWVYSSFLPSFGGEFILSSDILNHGPFGISLLRPQALFGISINDPLTHAVFWSIFLNALVFIIISLTSTPSPLERLQGQKFINVYGQKSNIRSVGDGVTPDDLFILAQRILGRKDAQILFDKFSDKQGQKGLPEINIELMETLEQKFAGSVGAATAHSMITQAVGNQSITVEDLIAVADETVQVIEYSARLEEQSKELTKAANELRIANNKLTKLSTQKDEFLSHVSHELRTPMTSIRSFSEILQSNKELKKDQLKYFSTIINDESKRLTRLLDEILDLSFLESGQVKLNISKIELNNVLEIALQSTQQTISISNAILETNIDLTKTEIQTDADRLSQVFINLITNAIKYNDKNQPLIEINCEKINNKLCITFQDNGPGIPKAERAIIFEKFTKLSSTENSSGVGLGLAISKEIMKNLGGSLLCLESKAGAKFQVQIPLN